MVSDEADDGLRSFDLVTLSGTLRVCEMEMVLLGSRSPRAAFVSRIHDDALFCRAQSAFAFRGRFMLPLDWCLLGFIHETGTESWCHGTPLPSNTALTVMPEGISEFVMSAGSRLSLMLVPLERVRRKFAELDPHSTELPMHKLALFMTGSGAAAEALRLHYERLYQKLAEGDAAAFDGDEVDVLLQEHLGAALAAASADRPQCSRGRRTHYLILQRAENFMRLNMRRDIYINEMCDAAGVSERALRYVFDDLLGTSPNRYLSMLRLCTACRSLSMADASRRSVKSIALSCGLWDLSRFADNYRRVFGELPRDTLMRTPPMDAISG